MLLDEIRTRSAAFAEVLKIVRRVADTNANVFLSGETGTGKDFIAGVIHDASSRRSFPFLKVDCASIPPPLAESEFFGYEKGAFSDASHPKLGKLQMAREGTLYLDGINHLSGTVQSKLLRFVQDRIVEPLGTTRSIHVDCRIIASCSVPLSQCLKEEQVRKDLYYRLASVSIELPPLRDRAVDLDYLVPEILYEFNKKYRKKCNVEPATIEFLKAYSWPGNIRELRNALERAVIHKDGVIGPALLELRQSVLHTESLNFGAEKLLSLEDMEKLYISQVLRKVKGHQSKAAGILKINRKTLLMKKRKYGID